MQICTSCNIEKEHNKFRITPKVRPNGEEYVYVQSQCKACIKIHRQRYLERTREHVQQRYKTYCENNREFINKLAREYRQENPGQKIRDNLSRRLRECISKDKTTAEYVGTKVSIIKQWLESNFTQQMNWNNYGTVWQIDHTIPIQGFELDNKNTSLIFDWKNLYPMLSDDNKKKQNKIIPERIQKQKQLVQEFVKKNKINQNTETYFEEYFKLVATHLN